MKRFFLNYWPWLLGAAGITVYFCTAGKDIASGAIAALLGRGTPQQTLPVAVVLPSSSVLPGTTSPPIVVHPDTVASLVAGGPAELSLVAPALNA